MVELYKCLKENMINIPIKNTSISRKPSIGNRDSVLHAKVSLVLTGDIQRSKVINTTKLDSI